MEVERDTSVEVTLMFDWMNLAVTSGFCSIVGSIPLLYHAILRCAKAHRASPKGSSSHRYAEESRTTGEGTYRHGLHVQGRCLKQRVTRCGDETGGRRKPPD